MKLGKLALILVSLSLNLTNANAQTVTHPNWDEVAREAADATDSEFREQMLALTQIPDALTKQILNQQPNSSFCSVRLLIDEAFDGVETKITPILLAKGYHIVRDVAFEPYRLELQLTLRGETSWSLRKDINLYLKQSVSDDPYNPNIFADSRRARMTRSANDRMVLELVQELPTCAASL